MGEAEKHGDDERLFCGEHAASTGHEMDIILLVVEGICLGKGVALESQHIWALGTARGCIETEGINAPPYPSTKRHTPAQYLQYLSSLLDNTHLDLCS